MGKEFFSSSLCDLAIDGKEELELLLNGRFNIFVFTCILFFYNQCNVLWNKVLEIN